MYVYSNSYPFEMLSSYGLEIRAIKTVDSLTYIQTYLYYLFGDESQVEYKITDNLLLEKVTHQKPAKISSCRKSIEVYGFI